MIIKVDERTLDAAAMVHAASWQASHRSFCTPDFVALHTQERQRRYLADKLRQGTKLYMLLDPEPVGIVSVTGSLIEDLYVLPERHGRGYGTLLLKHAEGVCEGTPSLWILQNNLSAARLYRRNGYRETGVRNRITDGLDEIEMRLTEEVTMDIWTELYERAMKEYHPEEVSPFVYAHHVVCALESWDGRIYTGFCIESCSGVMNLCAERVAALNMYIQSGQTRVRRLIAFRDKAPYGGGSGMPCGACREFLMQLDEHNKEMEIMVDYASRETVTLKELLPAWWGEERYQEAKKAQET